MQSTETENETTSGQFVALGSAAKAAASTARAALETGAREGQSASRGMGYVEIVATPPEPENNQFAGLETEARDAAETARAALSADQKATEPAVNTDAVQTAATAAKDQAAVKADPPKSEASKTSDDAEIERDKPKPDAAAPRAQHGAATGKASMLVRLGRGLKGVVNILFPRK